MALLHFLIERADHVSMLSPQTAISGDRTLVIVRAGPSRSDHLEGETTAFASSLRKSWIAVVTCDRDASSVNRQDPGCFHSKLDERAIESETLSSKEDDFTQTLVGLP